MLFYLIAFRKAPLSSLSDQTCQFWQSRNTRFIQVNRSKSGLNRNQPLTASDQPIRNYLWLVRTLLAQPKDLQADAVILKGSIIRPMDLKAGTTSFTKGNLNQSGLLLKIREAQCLIIGKQEYGTVE